MITLDMYRKHLTSRGHTLSEQRRRNSIDISEATFTGDPNYKQVRVLTRDGWQIRDAKYQFHTAISISKDSVDRFLQFRYGVEFPIGTYVILPDEDDTKLETYQDQLDRFDLSNRDAYFSKGDMSQLWIIVGRDNATTFVRYSILQVDWNFRWVYNGKICNVLGCLRSASSYTSGVWDSEYSTQLDDLTSAWIPDIHAVYGDKCSELGLFDNRMITHGSRFMLSNNVLNPSVYVVTKVKDVNPQGLIKLSLKQDEYNDKTDDAELLLCNCRNKEGTSTVDVPKESVENDGKIISLQLDKDGLLEVVGTVDYAELRKGEPSYFGINGHTNNPTASWKVTLMDDSMDDKHPASYYEKLMRITNIDDTTIMITPGKAGSLVGKRFSLCAFFSESNIHTSIIIQVIE